jgi:probable rRNA maturation factor
MRKTRPVNRRVARPTARPAKPPARPERLAVDVALQGVRTSINASRLKDLTRFVLRAERRRDAMISVAFVSVRAITELNEQYLEHHGPTDVISFALTAAGATKTFALGDIYICPVVARQHSRAFGVSFHDEIDRLVVHGTLHVLGWVHPDGAKREQSPMWVRQETLVRRWRAKAAAK